MLKAQLEIGGNLEEAAYQELAKILSEERFPIAYAFGSDTVADEPGQEVDPEWYGESLREASQAGSTLVLQVWETGDDEGSFVELYKDLTRLGLTYRVFNPGGEDLDRGGWRNASIAVYGPGVITGSTAADGEGKPILVLEEWMMADITKMLDGAQHLYQLRHQRLPPIALIE